MTIYEFFPVPPKACCLLCRRRVGSLPSQWQFPSASAVSLRVGCLPQRWQSPAVGRCPSAQVLRNSLPGHPPPSATTPAGRHLPAEFLSSVTTPAEMNWPAEFLDDLAGVCIIIIERNRLRANKMRKLSLLLRPARWYFFS